MRYLKNKTGEVYGYDKTQPDLIKKALEMGYADVTGSWPPKPTVAELNAQFNAPIKVKIQKLSDARLRPLAEGDTVYLAKLNKQVIALRAKLK